MIRSMLALAAAASLHGIAQAQATYDFNVHGSGTHLWNFYECGSAPDYQACAFGPGAYITPLVWGGTLHVTTSGSGDGAYGSFAGGRLLAFDMASNLVSFAGNDAFPGLSGGVGVVVENHRITSISGGGNPQNPSFDPYTQVFFNGLTVSYSFGDCHHCGVYEATATLSPVVIAVPEADTWRLVLAGLAALLAVAPVIRRAERRSDCRRSFRQGHLTAADRRRQMGPPMLELDARSWCRAARPRS